MRSRYRFGVVAIVLVVVTAFLFAGFGVPPKITLTVKHTKVEEANMPVPSSYSNISPQDYIAVVLKGDGSSPKVYFKITATAKQQLMGVRYVIDQSEWENDWRNVDAGVKFSEFSLDKKGKITWAKSVTFSKKKDDPLVLELKKSKVVRLTAYAMPATGSEVMVRAHYFVFDTTRTAK